MLQDFGCLQLDSAKSSGATNHEECVQTRIAVTRDTIWDAYRGNTFEHWAKQRCIIPESQFSHYYFAAQDGKAPEISWQKQADRKRECDPNIVDKIFQLVRASGKKPFLLSDLPDEGSMKVDWSSSTGTAKIATLALEILWQDLKVVVVGRGASKTRTNPRLHMLSEIAFPNAVQPSARPKEAFEDWYLAERVRQCGLLPLTNAQPQWCAMHNLKSAKAEIIDRLVASKKIERVRIEDEQRIYLAPHGFETTIPEDMEFDDRVRIIPPLDPIVWDHEVLQQCWKFDILREGAKTASKRFLGYYVMPLLYKGDFVGRMELVTEKTMIKVKGMWLTKEAPREAVYDAIVRHCRLNGFKVSPDIDKELSMAKEDPRIFVVPPEFSTRAPPKRKPKKGVKMEDGENENQVEEAEIADEVEERPKSASSARSKKRKAASSGEDSDDALTLSKPVVKSEPGRRQPKRAASAGPPPRDHSEESGDSDAPTQKSAPKRRKLA